jgi:hypothetical protein
MSPLFSETSTNFRRIFGNFDEFSRRKLEIFLKTKLE